MQTLWTFNTNCNANLPWVLGFFGWRKLTGTVIAVEPPYMAKPETDWLHILLKLAMLARLTNDKVLWGILLLPVILGVIIAGLIVGITFSILGIGSSRFFSGLASQIIGFFLTGKLFGPKEQVPVRDIRLRDDSGQEHLVRIRGELFAGNISVGDEVEVEGFNRRGTLMLRCGLNKRTRHEILRVETEMNKEAELFGSLTNAKGLWSSNFFFTLVFGFDRTHKLSYNRNTWSPCEEKQNELSL